MQNLLDFKNWLLLNCGAKASANTHLNNLKDFFRHNEIFNQESVNKFLIEGQEKWQTTTFNMYLNSLKWYARFLKIELEFPKFKRINTKVKSYINRKDLDDILIKLPLIFMNYKKVQTILILLFEGGLRPKELLTLKRSDFDFSNNSVLLRDTKTKLDRTPPLSDKTSMMIQDYFSVEAEGDNAFNLTFFTLKYIFQQINKYLNLKKKISPYLFRRSYAHNMIKSGIKLTSLQIGMGHQRVETTLGYLSVSKEEANDEIRTILNRKERKIA